MAIGMTVFIGAFIGDCVMAMQGYSPLLKAVFPGEFDFAFFLATLAFAVIFEAKLKNKIHSSDEIAEKNSSNMSFQQIRALDILTSLKEGDS